MLQSGSLLVLLLLIIGHYEQFKRKWLAVISILSILFAFLIYWILPEYAVIEIWYWKPLIAIGMISFVLTFPYLLTKTSSY